MHQWDTSGYYFQLSGRQQQQHWSSWEPVARHKFKRRKYSKHDTFCRHFVRLVLRPWGSLNDTSNLNQPRLGKWAHLPRRISIPLHWSPGKWYPIRFLFRISPGYFSKFKVSRRLFISWQRWSIEHQPRVYAMHKRRNYWARQHIRKWIHDQYVLRSCSPTVPKFYEIRFSSVIIFRFSRAHRRQNC